MMNIYNKQILLYNVYELSWNILKGGHYERFES